MRFENSVGDEVVFEMFLMGRVIDGGLVLIVIVVVI